MPQTNDVTITIKADDDASDVLKKLQKEVTGLGKSSIQQHQKLVRKD